MFTATISSNTYGPYATFLEMYHAVKAVGGYCLEPNVMATHGPVMDAPSIHSVEIGTWKKA